VYASPSLLPFFLFLKLFYKFRYFSGAFCAANRIKILKGVIKWGH